MDTAGGDADAEDDAASADEACCSPPSPPRSPASQLNPPRSQEGFQRRGLACALPTHMRFTFRPHSWLEDDCVSKLLRVGVRFSESFSESTATGWRTCRLLPRAGPAEGNVGETRPGAEVWRGGGRGSANSLSGRSSRLREGVRGLTPPSPVCEMLVGTAPAPGSM